MTAVASECEPRIPPPLGAFRLRSSNCDYLGIRDFDESVGYLDWLGYLITFAFDWAIELTPGAS